MTHWGNGCTRGDNLFLWLFFLGRKGETTFQQFHLAYGPSKYRYAQKEITSQTN